MIVLMIVHLMCLAIFLELCSRAPALSINSMDH